MFGIPNIPSYMPDEITYSFVCRMAEANCFSSPNKFYSELVSYSKRSTAFDDRDMFRQMKQLTDACSGIITLYDLIMDTTLLPGLWPLLTPERQDRYMLKACAYPEVIGRYSMPALADQYCYCPICRNEDVSRYGFHYLHRIHHLPGIGYCPSHHCRLRRLKDDKEIIVDFTRDDQAQYEDILCGLLKTPVPCSSMDIADACRKRASEMTNGSPYGYMAQYLRSVGYQPAGDAGKVSGLISRNGLPVIVFAKLLGHLFGDRITLDAYLGYDTGAMETVFQRSLEGSGFTTDVFSPFAVKMRHDTCGTEFYSSPHAFVDGWRCPACDREIGKQALFEQLVLHMGDGVYEVRSGYVDLRHKVLLYHKDCGTEFQISAGAFLFDHARCKCGRIYTMKQAAAKLAEKGPYTLEEYEGIDKPVKIRADICGHVFRMGSLRKFMDVPYCRTCHPNETNEETFKKEIKDLCGDEYEYVNGYEGRLGDVIIRHHSTRGDHDFHMMPMAFLNGQRCPYCKKQVKKTDFVRVVRELSSGRYEVIGFRGDTRCTIMDTATGSKKVFGRGFVLQELTRPTPSQALPHKMIDTSGCCKNTMEIVLKAVMDKYPTNYQGKIYADDIFVDGMNRIQVMRVMSVQLVKAGYLIKTGNKTYIWRIKRETQK